MQVRRDRSELVVGVIIGALLSAAGLALVIVTLSGASPLRHAQTRRATDQGRGGAVFVSGRLSSQVTMRSPSGREGAVWAARVGRMEGSKAPVFVSYCDLTALDGATVGEFSLRHYDVPSASVRDMPKDDYKVTIDLGIEDMPRMPIPTIAAARCPNVPSDAYYQEVVIGAGTPLTVSGCVHAKTPLYISPCGDDADFVSTSSAKAVLDRLRNETGKNYVLSCLFAVIGLALCMVVATRARTVVAKEPS